MRITSPSPGIASTSSPFAFWTPSIEPTPSRWAGLIVVTTPMVGWASWACAAISPKAFMPNSSTAASCPGSIPSSVRGTPHWLFWLPAALRIRRRTARTPAVSSFVVVFPFDPVIPTSGMEWRRRWNAARRWM